MIAMGEENVPPENPKLDIYRLTREKRKEFEALVDHYGATEEQMAAWKKYFSRCQNKAPKPCSDAIVKQAIELWQECRHLSDEKQWDHVEKAWLVTSKRKIAEGLWNEERCDDELLALRKAREHDRLGLLQIPDPMLKSDWKTAKRLYDGNKGESHSGGLSEDARFILRAFRHDNLSILRDKLDDGVSKRLGVPRRSDTEATPPAPPVRTTSRA